ncbi:hypothetical protein PoB_000648000 [Plakobranchus ocellatus]|uniref:Uncharacterized protein n=1 Tax=Plakobranchus ocellatus TaxID=259542 RepID=A0AAV3YBV3_9GAST|nr:hypothetical protein PoB_000648000 [Plakobranchus ocellatus]
MGVSACSQNPPICSPVRLVMSRAELQITTHTPNIQLYSANIKHDYISPNITPFPRENHRFERLESKFVQHSYKDEGNAAIEDQE